MSESLVPKVVGVASLLIAMMTLSVLIRFFVRGCLLRKLDWDDGEWSNAWSESVADFGHRTGLRQLRMAGL